MEFFAESSPPNMFLGRIFSPAFTFTFQGFIFWLKFRFTNCHSKTSSGEEEGQVTFSLPVFFGLFFLYFRLFGTVDSK